MKKWFIVLLALGVVMVMSTSMISACDTDEGHPDLTGQHCISAYVCPFAQIAWGDVEQTILEGDGRASVTPGSITFDVEANCTVRLDIAGEDFVGKYLHDVDGKIFPQLSEYSLTPSFSWSNRNRFYDDSISTSQFDCTKKSFKVYFKAAPKTRLISGTHAGTYVGTIKVTVTQQKTLILDNWQKPLQKFDVPSHDCQYL